MKTWILAGTLGACALLANAQSLPDSQTVVIPGGRLQTIELPAHRHFMNAQDFAPFRGGPIQYIRATGADALVERLKVLQQRYGDRFAPRPGWESPVLREPVI